MGVVSNSKVRKAPTTIRLAIAERGHRLHNLWVVWSYKLQETCLLPSDAALFHFALLESDPTVATFKLESPSLSTFPGNDPVGTRFDAEVFFKDGRISWDEVKADLRTLDEAQKRQIEAQRFLAVTHGVLYRLFSLKELAPHTNRVWNSLRMLQVLHAANGFSVAAQKTLVLSRLCGGSASIKELIELGDGDRGLVLAAAFGLMLDAVIYGDVESAPLTLETRLFRHEVEND
jgi:hypothetical protein